MFLPATIGIKKCGRINTEINPFMETKPPHTIITNGGFRVNEQLQNRKNYYFFTNFLRSLIISPFNSRKYIPLANPLISMVKEVLPDDNLQLY